MHGARHHNPMFLLASLPLLLCAGCPDLDGTEEGGPCNAQGVCLPGLVCEEGICKDKNSAAWQLMKVTVNNHLYGVASLASGEVIAVGESGTILRYHPAEDSTGALEWDAIQPLDTENRTLKRIWSDGSALWITGYRLSLHYDGTTWTKLGVHSDTSELLEDFDLLAVQGAGGEVFAVGRTTTAPGRNLLLRYDATGRSWAQVPGSEAKLQFAPKDLWVTPSGAITVVGDALHAAHFDGKNWDDRSLGVTGNPVELRAIWGTPDGSQLYAVGESGVRATYDGSSWTVSDEGHLPFVANDIWGRSAQDLFIVGDGTGSSYNDKSGIERCAPSCSYNPVPEGQQGTDLEAIWAAADGKTLYAVGEKGVILRRVLQ